MSASDTLYKRHHANRKQQILYVFLPIHTQIPTKNFSYDFYLNHYKLKNYTKRKPQQLLTIELYLMKVEKLLRHSYCLDRVSPSKCLETLFLFVDCCTSGLSFLISCSIAGKARLNGFYCVHAFCKQF